LEAGVVVQYYTWHKCKSKIKILLAVTGKLLIFTFQTCYQCVDVSHKYSVIIAALKVIRLISKLGNVLKVVTKRV